MYDKICSEARFLDDVKDHQIETFFESDQYRYIRFKKPKSITYWFDLITWNGQLCVSGDCGTFVFDRVPDMFEFFRDGKKDGPLKINPQYWAEKIEATEKDGGHKQWSLERFKACVKEDVDAVLGEMKDDEDKCASETLWHDLERDVFSNADNKYSALTAIENFENDIFEFDSLWEHDCTEYTFHYLWCCYAIVWGIRQYDKQKENMA